MRALLQSDKSIIDVHEHYIKQTVRNRCTIITANGLMNLVIPVQRYRNHTPVASIKVDHATNWQRVHINAIRSAYGKSPYFEFYGDKILSLYEWKAETLVEWNAACLSAVCSVLKVNPLVMNSTGYVDSGQPDLRSEAFPVELQQAPRYTQTFMERHGFYAGLSILDLLFCTGPDARRILQEAK